MRQLADAAGIRFGSAVSGILFDRFDKRGDKTFIELFRRDFNLAIVHAGIYWGGYEPEPEKEDEGSIWFIGRQIAELHSVGIHDIRGHPLVYPKYSPQWLRDGVNRGEISKEQLTDHMKRHITSLVKRWNGKIREWVVVNEPYRHYPDDDDYFQTLIGDEYVDMAFQMARELDPEARLIFNDTLNHASGGYDSVWNVSQAFNTQQTRDIANRLNTKGLIDGVGLQMHLDGANPPDKMDVIQTMQSYGVPVHVTEFDVNMRNVPGTQEERFAKQAQIYADCLDACFQSGVCKSFNLWEFGDKYSWLEDPQFGGSPDADPTPYDDNFQPKPAYYALYDVLSRWALAR